MRRRLSTRSVARALVATCVPGLVLAMPGMSGAAAKKATGKRATADQAALDRVEKEVHEFTLANGLRFIVLERHDAPVFSFVTQVNAGGVDEVPGITGIAHMFEHMAFKGTTTIATTDMTAEQRAIDAVDHAWDAYAAEEIKGFGADSTKLKTLQSAYVDARKKAQEYVVTNDFSKILEENGVTNLNANTGTDATTFFYSLPSNRLELWARLEGDRLTNPVLREFYVERDVVYEERRFMESSPTGRLFDAFLAAAFLAHPYGNGVIGFPSDLKRITEEDARAFFDKYYVAGNMSVVVVGDVRTDEVKRLAEKYFSGVRKGPRAPLIRTQEPPHEAEIRMVREEDVQPMMMIGYHIPGHLDPDWYVYDLLSDVAGTGRSSRLYKRLVKQDQVASSLDGGVGWPGEKYPNLLGYFVTVAPDATPAKVEAAFEDEMARLAKDGPTDAELAKVKQMGKAAFLRGLDSNEGLSLQLANMQTLYGDWHQLFHVLDRRAAVTRADIQRAATETFRRGNRTIVLVQKPVS